MERKQPGPLNFDAAGVPRVDDDVVAAMIPWLGEAGARAEGLHATARSARRALDEAREGLGALAGAAPDRVVFTSSASESVVQVARAAASHPDGRRRTLCHPLHEATIITAAVRASARDRGEPVHWLPVDVAGFVHLEPAAGKPRVVVLSWAHPVLGTIQDVPGLAHRLAPEAGVLAVDASWALGRMPVDFATLEGDVVLFAELAPLGVPHGLAVSYLPETFDTLPLLPGGLEQDGRRAGAVPVALAVGAGVAARRLSRGLDARVGALREAAARLAAGVAAVPGVVLPGPPVGQRIPGHVALAVPGLRADALVLALSERGVLASPGSPCGEAGLPASSLLAAGLPEAVARGVVVLAMPAGAPATPGEVDRAVAGFGAAVAALRAVAGLRG